MGSGVSARPFVPYHVFLKKHVVFCHYMPTGKAYRIESPLKIAGTLLLTYFTIQLAEFDKDLTPLYFGNP